MTTVQPDALNCRVFALIPCAGNGSRAATVRPKQYVPVAGQPMVMHTLAAFAAVQGLGKTLVVVAPDDVFFDQRLSAGLTVARCGGTTRSASVTNGLKALMASGAFPTDWVLVHDAARCLITTEQIAGLIATCRHDAVGGLLAHPVTDTLKLGAGGRVTLTRDRAQHWLAQTPQMFRIGCLRSALRAAGERITDESSAIEALGLSPKLVSGSATNFKVTYAEDFAMAHAELAARARKPAEELNYDYP